MTAIDKRKFFGQLNYTPHAGQEQLHAALQTPGIDWVIAMCGTRFGKCSRGNTEVYDLTTGRRRRVDELGPLMVQSWDESTLKSEPRPATAFASGRKPCVRVTLKSGQQIELSTDHPMLTERGWVEAALVQPGTLIATPRALPEPQNPLLVPDAELVVMASLITDGSTRATGCNFTQMPGEMLDEFRFAVETLGGRLHRLADSGKAQQFSVSGIADRVRAWGFRGQTHDQIRLPAEYYGLASELIGRLLSIIWACDGWFSIKGSKIIGLTLANRLLLEDVRHLLLRLGIHGRVRFTPKTCTNAPGGPKKCDAWTLSITGAANIRAFCTAVERVPGKQSYIEALRDVIGKQDGRSDSDLVPIGREQIKTIGTELGLPSRQCRDLYFQCTEGHRLTRAKFAAGVVATNYAGRFSALADSDVLWSRVESVESIGEHDVYDLSVEGNHNFAANNIIVHNTVAAAHEMVYEAMLPRKDFMGWCVAPSTKVADAIFDMVIQLMQQIQGSDLRLDRNDGVLEFKNFGGGRSRIMRRTTQGAKGKARLAAFAVDFMVIDEASDQELYDQVWQSQLRTRLVDRQGKLLAISTPRGQRGWFVALHRLALREGTAGRAIAVNFPSWLNSVMFPGGFMNPKIQKEYKTQPLRDFLQEYGAQPMSAEGAIFEPETVDGSCVLDDWEDPIAAGEYYSGYDIGLKRDSSVHTIVRAPLGFKNASPAAKVVYVRHMKKMPVEAQLELLKQDQERYGIQSIFMDGTGIGEPIYQQARNEGLFVRSVVFSKKSKMPMIVNLLGLLQQRKVRLPKALLCPSMRDQLLIYEWDKNGITANAPEGAHDDYVCSLALACKAFPAIMSEGDGQAFVHKSTTGDSPGAPPTPPRAPQRVRESDKPTVRVIRATPDDVQTFTQKHTNGGGGLWGGNSVLGF